MLLNQTVENSFIAGKTCYAVMLTDAMAHINNIGIVFTETFERKLFGNTIL
jgi:hypothetical protein